MYIPQFLDLRAGFSKYLSVVPATTQALRDECYRIRHDVYCRELGFEAVREDGSKRTPTTRTRSIASCARTHRAA